MDYNMIDYHQAIKEMHKGHVVQYIGTVNGPVWSDRGAMFCMCRGCIFLFDKEIKWNKMGYMVYDPDYRYKITDLTVDTRAWKQEDKREIKSKLGYSRIGLNNI